MVLAASILVVVVGLMVLFFMRQSKRRNASESIILRNNKEISLGLPVDELSKIPEVFKIDDQDYQYPILSGRKPAEIVIFVEQGRVVAYKLLEPTVKVQSRSDIRVGMKTSDLKSKLGNKLKPFYKILKVGVAQGYVEENKESVSYYLINPCKAKVESVVVIGMALKGYEDKIVGVGTGCNSHGN